jgi:hypothetical protein
MGRTLGEPLGDGPMSNPQTPTTRTYAAWFAHARKCGECKRVTKAVDGCEEGRELWGTYRLACVGTNTGGGN